jgi:hypothetical protein
MKRLAVAAAVIFTAVIGTGSAGGGLISTPAKIQRSIADGCKSRPVRAPFPNDPVHQEYAALAEEAMVIRCPGKPKNRSAYARFASNERLNTALASIILPPASVESYCVTQQEAFTSDFWGSFNVCKKVGGRFRNVRSPPLPSAVTHITYVPNCGNTNFLEFKQREWSNGCTAGSANVQGITWRLWNEHVATGSGTAGLRGGCHPDCSEKDAYYKAKAKLRLYRPQPCSDQGVTLQYFTRAHWKAYLRPGNPFDRPAGWWKVIYKAHAYQGECMLTQEFALWGD